MISSELLEKICRASGATKGSILSCWQRAEMDCLDLYGVAYNTPTWLRFWAIAQQELGVSHASVALA